MADVRVNQLTQVTAVESVDSLVMVDRTTNEGRIIDASTFAKSTGCVVVTCTGVSSLPHTPSASLENLSKVTSDMVVVGSYLSVPSAMGSDWTVNTADKTLTITGTFNGTTATDVTLYLQVQR